MKRCAAFLIILFLVQTVSAGDTDILKYIDGGKTHNIQWLTYTSDEGETVKAETTTEIPAFFIGHYITPEANRHWRDAEMEFRADGTGWFQVYKGGFDVELDDGGNSIKKEFEWGVILNEDTTIHVIDNSDNPRVNNKNEIMCAFKMEDGQAAVWNIMIWDGKPYIGRVYVKD